MDPSSAPGQTWTPETMLIFGFLVAVMARRLTAETGGSRRANPASHIPHCYPPNRRQILPFLPISTPLRFTMLDSFEILTTSGVVLWKKSYFPVGENIINGLINDMFIEEKRGVVTSGLAAGQAPSYKKEKYTLKWTTVRELGLIFVVRLSPVPPRTCALPGAWLTMSPSPTGRLPVPPPPFLGRQAAREHQDHLRGSL